MARGRRSTPTVLRLLQGNPGKRPLNLDEPKYQPVTETEPPEILNEHGKETWRRMVSMMGKCGVLTQADLETLTVYCQSYGEWYALAAEAKGAAPIIETEYGPKANPIFRMLNAAADKLRKLAVEFGLTPCSRTRLKVNGSAEKQDGYTTFKKKKKQA